MKLDQPKPRPRMKRLSAAMGGSAVMAMGAVSLALSHESNEAIVSEPFTFTSPAPPDMSTGEKAVSPTLEPTVTAESAAPGITTTPTSSEPD